ncbi:conjugal transfer protein TraH [Aeromonas hydrophila]|uniref:Conjugal transfer protein TraH n=1 Tax=Aeromonas hydrophila TaxID=644 RepID=A0A926FLU4_AERHY|nr:conjugal transfer protein TraH [Aeromonas hydrophila]
MFGYRQFFGAFSMVSSEQLTALAKAIAQNGGSFAFDLALSTLSPVIAEKFNSSASL